ncbi:hypothetical protein [Streptomyces lavendulae]|uniref:hypothetical protein n=1 Tax=Streptomyces lavendulae TaxID=1914 RepID=UPI0038309BFE
MTNSKPYMISPVDTDTVTVPTAVLSDPRFSLADIGLYVKILHVCSFMGSPIDVDALVAEVRYGRNAERPGMDEASVREAINRFVEAELFDQVLSR